MNRLPAPKRAKILSLMVEGLSLRSIARVEDVSIVTVGRLLRLAGEACSLYHDEFVRGISGKRNIQCDEIWSFVYAKQKNAPYADPWDAAGNAWTFTALDADTKLLVSYLVSQHRDTRSAAELRGDVSDRLQKRPRITVDELKSYKKAAKSVFGKKAKRTLSQTRKGENTDHNTAYVERHNLTIRMSNRRFNRKTNAFSKRFSKHIDMMHLFAVHYNFCRIHKTLRVTPAMEAGLTGTLFDCEWIVALIDTITPPPSKKPGPKIGTKYKPRVKAKRDRTPT